MVAYLSAPVAIVKSFISIIHGIVACANLSKIDIEERKVLLKKQ